MTSMTIEEARGILGNDGDESDEELRHMIDTMEAIARETIRAHVRGEFHMSDDSSKDLPRKEWDVALMMNF